MSTGKSRWEMLAIIVLSFSLTARAAILEGTVKSYVGSPLANATVKVLLGDAEIQRTNSDAAGAYRIEGLASGEYEVVIFQDGYQGERTAVSLAAADSLQVNQFLFPLGIQPENACDFEGDISFRIAPGNKCSGSFQRSDEEKKHGSYSGQFNFDFTQTGADEYKGRYISYEFLNRPGGITEGQRIAFWIKAVGDPYGVLIRVVDKNNETYQPADLIVGSTDAGWTFVSAVPATSWGHFGGDGNNKLDYPLTLQAILIQKNRGSASYQTSGAYYLDDVMIIDSTVRHGAFAAQVLDDGTGFPFAGVNVRLYDQSRGYAIREAVTSSDGRILLENLPVGTFWAEIPKAGYKTLWQKIQLNADEITTVSFRLRNSGTLSGKVYNSQNVPLASALVAYQREEGGNYLSYTAPDGSFSLANIVSGRGQLLVYNEGFKLERRSVECLPDETVQLGEIKLSQAQDDVAPSPVSGSVAADTPLTLRLAWTAASDDVGLFLIYRGAKESFPCTQETLLGVCLPEGTAMPGTEYEFIDRQISEIKTFYYAIVAVDQDGNRSQPFYLAKKPLSPYPPAEPDNEQGAILVNNKPIFSWLPVAGAERYRLELAREADFEEITFALDNIPNLADQDNRIRFYLDQKLSEGKWWWRACAVFPSGIWSDYTEIDSFEVVDTEAGLAVPYLAISPAAIQPHRGAPEVKMRFVVARTAELTLRIFNRQGRCVRELLSGDSFQGIEDEGENELQEVTWDGRDSKQRPVPNGLYYAQLQVREAGGNRAKQIVKRVGVFR